MTATKHLLHLLALALFLYILAFMVRSEVPPAVFATFLGAGMIAELLFWIGLFKKVRRRW